MDGQRKLIADGGQGAMRCAAGTHVVFRMHFQEANAVVVAENGLDMGGFETGASPCRYL